MVQPITLIGASAPDRAEISKADLNELFAEINGYRQGADAGTAEQIIAVLGALRPRLEALVPELDYFKANAIGDYLRPLSDLVSHREHETYPWPSD